MLTISYQSAVTPVGVAYSLLYLPPPVEVT